MYVYIYIITGLPSKGGGHPKLAIQSIRYGIYIYIYIYMY